MASSFTSTDTIIYMPESAMTKVNDAVNAIKDELMKLKRRYHWMIQTAKEQLKGSYIFSLENVNGRMFSIGKICYC